MTKSNALRFLLMSGAAAGVFAAAPAFAQASPGVTTSDEIIVTARRREESVRDVPASVSALSGAQLEETGAQSFEDYIATVPGATYNNYNPGWAHVVLRGIATSAGNEQGQGTVGYYINDVPLTEPGWTIVVPDIDAFDVNRVEILRGPQGALFGSASLGGVVNYFARTADASGMDAALEGTLSTTENADESYALKGMINLPLVEDVFAIRAVYTRREDAGFLDNVGTGESGANDVTTQGGRFSAVWTPDAQTELAYLGLTQNTDVADGGFRIQGLGEFERTSEFPESIETEVTVHSLRFERDLGFASLTAVAATTDRSQDWIFDFTPIMVFYNADLDLNLPGPLYIVSGGESEGRSFEARLASTGDGPVQWLVGAMWFQTEKFLYEAIGSPDAASQFDASSLFGPGSGAIIAPDGEIFNTFESDVEGEEVAVFGQVSWEFAPSWTVSGGGRLFRTEVATTTSQFGFSTYPGAPIVDTQTTEDDGFSPMVSLEWKPNDNLMVYGLVSEGFRFGQPNNIPDLPGFDTPDGSSSDSLTNYEIGVRAQPSPGLTFDVTAFFVDWTDIQIRLQRPDFFNYAGNGGGAESKGVEVAIGWSPSQSVALRSAVTYINAELTEDLVIPFAGTAAAGSPLPGSAEWTMSNTLVWALGGPLDATAVLLHRYVGEGVSDLTSVAAGAPNEQGDYNVFDARLRLDVGQVGVTFFANNISDERGVTRTVSEVHGIGEGIVRPRSIGVTLNWGF